MAFYQQDDDPKPLGVVFREGLDALRVARFKLAHAQLSAQQMTDQEFGEEFGYPGEASAAKAEMLSGIGNLLSTDSGVNAAQTSAAVAQMLAQFG